MLVRDNFIVTPEGDVVISKTIDSQDVVDDVDELRQTTQGWSEDRSQKLLMSVPVHEYHYWKDQVGEDCWEDPDFLKFFKSRRPEFCL